MKLTKKNSVLKLFVEDHKRSIYGLLYLLSYAIFPFIIGHFFKDFGFPVYPSGLVVYMSLQCVCGIVWFFIYALRYLLIDNLLMATLMSYMPVTKEDLVNNNITDLNKWLLLMKYLGDKYFRKMLAPSVVIDKSDFKKRFKESYQVFLDYIEEVTDKKPKYFNYSDHGKGLICSEYIYFYVSDNEHLKHLADEEYFKFILNEEE